jgi:hypothetical protein
MIAEGGHRVTSVAPPVRSARFALGFVGLVLLFGLGYQISLRRLHHPAPEVSAQ